MKTLSYSISRNQRIGVLSYLSSLVMSLSTKASVREEKEFDALYEPRMREIKQVEGSRENYLD